MAGTVVGPQRSGGAREARAASARPWRRRSRRQAPGVRLRSSCGTAAPLGLRHPGARAGRAPRSTPTWRGWLRGARSAASGPRCTGNPRPPRSFWERQLAAGAWGITLATPSQVRVALAFGLRRVLSANALVDPVGIAAVSCGTDADPELQALSWVTPCRPSPRWTPLSQGCTPRAADRARRARRSGRAHRGPRPAGSARRGDGCGREPAPAPGRGSRLRGRAGPRRVACRARRRPPLPARPRHPARRARRHLRGRRRGRHCRRQRLLRRRRGRPRPAGRAGHAGSAAVGRLHHPRRRLLPGHLAPRPARRHPAGVGDARLGPRGLPTRARARPARRRQAGRPVRRGAARAAAGRRRARGAGAPPGRGDHRGQRPAAFLRLPPAPRWTSVTSSGWACRPLHGLRQWREIPMVAGRRIRTPSSSISSAPTSDEEPVSTLIRAATVVDGTERPRYRADVLVDGPWIAAILPAGGPAPDTDRVLDADGLVLAPGFIDMHAHSDLQILLQPDHLAKISQGATTELLGQDGLSYAPVDDDALAMLRKKIAGWNTDPADFDFSWRTVGGTSTGSTGASPATRPTWSHTAWSGRWSAGGTTCRRAPTTSWRCRRSCAPRWPRGPSACRPGSPTPPACTPTTPSCSPCARPSASSAGSSPRITARTARARSTRTPR